MEISVPALIPFSCKSLSKKMERMVPVSLSFFPDTTTFMGAGLETFLGLETGSPGYLFAEKICRNNENNLTT